jgi:hypothetical protein
MIAWLICKLKGHRRAKHVRTEGNVRVLACPRCGRENRVAERAPKVPRPI